MSALTVQPPFEIFTDIDGQPLEAGYVWIGTVNLDPQTNPIQVYWDQALTILAPQPLRTIGGYIVNSGTPAKVYIDGASYSIRVMNKNGSTLYTDLNNTGIDPNASGIVYDPAGIGAVPTTVQDKLRETVSVKDFGAVGDGVTDSTLAIQAAVNYAQTLTSGNALRGYGVSIIFPAGSYLITSSINVTDHGIGFVGESGKGSEIKGDVNLFNVGDYTNTIRVRYTTFSNLNFVSTNTSGIVEAIKLYRTAATSFQNCKFISWYIGIDTYRSSTTEIVSCDANNGQRTAQALAWLRAQGLDETVSTGEVYTPGGGFHITDCEISGNSNAASFDTTSGILLLSCDGFYMTQTHFTGCVVSLDIAPDATAANHYIFDIQVNNCYFDEPSVISTTYNAALRGTVKETITMASGATQTSGYNGFRFVNTLFRGANYVTNNFIVEVTDGDSWYDSNRRLKDIVLTACTFKGATSTNVLFKGGVTNHVEPTELVINGNVFSDGNSSGAGSIGAAININSENCVISDNTFGPSSANSDYIIFLAATDAGTADNPNPAGMVIGNDLSKAPVFDVTSNNPEPVRFAQGNSENSNTLQAFNLYYGTGRRVDQQYKLTTTDATTQIIWSFAIPDSVAGAVTATISGSNSDGTKAVSYEFYAGFRNNGTSSSLSTGTTDWTSVRAWNPDSIATPPTAQLNTNSLRLRVTGVAAETWSWSAVVELSACR